RQRRRDMATWIVTGSNRGIGLAMCRQLHARGDAVFAACRRTSKELSAIGCPVIEGVDVATAAAAGAIDAALGDRTVDVLMNNAGVLVPDRLEALDFEAVKRQYEVNTV